MPNFGYGSLKQLDTIHPKLQAVLKEAIKTFDFSVTCGFRNEKDQNAALQSGASKLAWPKSRHNTYPSEAADLLPYPFQPSEDWKDTARFAMMMGHVEAAAQRLGIPIELGMDWDMDQKTIDESFRDFPHVQLKRPI
jgi:peptidoglycan L-alanyl-D-glutamate endopeptidase CwlK